jgi:hypothetical protein
LATGEDDLEVAAETPRVGRCSLATGDDGLVAVTEGPRAKSDGAMDSSLSSSNSSTSDDGTSIGGQGSRLHQSVSHRSLIEI